MMADDPAGKLANGALFVDPAFYNLTKAGFGYANLNDQMLDASRNWAKGAGVFAGNNVPKFNGLPGSDPNGTFGGGFATMAPNVGGGLLGASAYSGGFNPFAGRGNGGGGAGGGSGGGSGGSGGAGGSGGWAGGATGPGMAGLPGAGTTPTSTFTSNPSGGDRPGFNYNALPVGAPPPTGSGGMAGLLHPGAALPPIKSTPGMGGAAPANGLPTGVVNMNPANWQTPGADALSNDYYKYLAQSHSSDDAMKLSELVGDETYHQLQNYYHAGGAGHDPQAIMDQYRGEEGGAMGIDTLMAPIRAMYEANGIIVNGKWAKKQDPNGNWIPI